MRKNKLLLLLALLMTAATGAWAQEPATTYTVKMKDGTVDAKNWTIASGEKSATGDAADGLTGLSEKDAVTLQYNGRLKVKGVKATSDAAPAPSVPDGAISGVFSVSSTKQVYFSKGNLRYASGAWSFFDNQYDYYESYSADAWDHLGWSTSATTYGMNTSEYNSSYSGDFVDWGAMMGAGWFTLSSDEWKYLINTRSASTVNGTENGRYAKAKVNNVGGVIIFPDTYTHPDGVAAPTGVNSTLSTGWNGNSYTVADWTKMESAGCVFLPAAGYREGSSVSNPGTYGRYWSATPNGLNYAYGVLFTSDVLNPAYEFTRYRGCSVRLVREVATSDEAPAKTPATVTTAPQAKTDVEAGSTTALIEAGVADGGTMMYAVTTTNTKPTSTEGFSATVPTAQTCAAGTVYVWYYVKANDTHTDSEIAGPVSVTVKAAVPSESFTTNQGIATYDGTHFTITCTTVGDSDGIEIEESKPLTITAKNGETITKVEFHCTIGSGWASQTTVTAGTLNWTTNSATGSIDNVNASTVSMSNSTVDWVQINQITVYYAE